jgi:hypothetical protein
VISFWAQADKNDRVRPKQAAKGRNRLMGERVICDNLVKMGFIIIVLLQAPHLRNSVLEMKSMAIRGLLQTE